MTIIHGQDYPKSYQKLRELLKSGQVVHTFSAKSVSLTQLTQLLDNPDLFGDTPTVVIEDVFSLPASKARERLLDYLKLHLQSDLTLFETKAINGNSLKAFAKAKIIESTPEAIIFKFLVQVLPSNSSKLLSLYEEILLQDVAPEYLFAMLIWHFRQLLNASSNPALPAWQAGKFKNLLRRFPVSQILTAYEQLYQIDQIVKTGQSTVSLRELLYGFFAKL